MRRQEALHRQYVCLFEMGTCRPRSWWSRRGSPSPMLSCPPNYFPAQRAGMTRTWWGRKRRCKRGCSSPPSASWRPRRSSCIYPHIYLERDACDVVYKAVLNSYEPVTAATTHGGVTVGTALRSTTAGIASGRVQSLRGLSQRCRRPEHRRPFRAQEGDKLSLQAPGRRKKGHEV